MLGGFVDLSVAVACGFVLVAGVGFALIVGGKFGAGPHTALEGLFPAQWVRDWPTGVQESDAPRFDVAHLDALRRGVTVEIVELEQPAPIALQRVAVSVGWECQAQSRI